MTTICRAAGLLLIALGCGVVQLDGPLTRPDRVGGTIGIVGTVDADDDAGATRR